MTSYPLKNGQRLDIRPAVPEDAPQLLAYLPLIGAESDNLLFGKEGVGLTIESEQKLLRDINEEPNSVFLLGSVKGVLVATCSIRASQRERKRHQGTFAIAVRKPFWNLGIGSKMGREALEWAQSTGILTVVQLTVRTDNVHAIRLYERLGFRPVGILHRDLRIHGEYHDTLMMEWVMA